MRGLDNFQRRARQLIFALAIPGALMAAEGAVSQIRIEQVDPGVLIKPQQIETPDAGTSIVLEQIDPDRKPVVSRPAAAAGSATAVRRPARQVTPIVVAIAQPEKMPFVRNGVQMAFPNDPERNVFPTVFAKVELQ